MQNPHSFMLKRRDLLQAGAAVLGTSLLPTTKAQNAYSRPIKVMAASDLKFALTDVVALYKKEAGQEVQVTFGSSGNLMRQIQQGLEADVFMSADEGFVLALAKTGKTLQGMTGTNYGRGRLALWAANPVSVVLDARLDGLRAGWSKFHKFAIAQPDHAPYGRAAREVLQATGLWDALQPRLVLGDNVLQTMQFLTTGAAQLGITSLSLALAPQFQAMGRYVVLPDTLHGPLNQRAVLLAGASAAAQAFYAYFLNPKTRGLLDRYGFESPA